MTSKNPNTDDGSYGVATDSPLETNRDLRRSGVFTRIRERWPELVIEMISITVAISLAFALDEWADGRHRREQAQQLRAAVVEEVRRNAEDVSGSQAEFDATLQQLKSYRKDPDAPSFVSVSLDVALLSGAAYSVMQASDAGSDIDIEWRINVARIYAMQDIVNTRQQHAIDALISLQSSRDRLPATLVDDLYAELSALGQLRERLTQLYDEVRE